ncbi:hypothetical protein CI610_01516 [invertebrate metagenome]|uniref:KANL3/Tex30 alpha/beta hydrolase-like domain-containing protein n=1 Tax=invertebrate metagenome TaxID=1711999 RepID=A0A2H9T8E0_9ZZZZ
MEQQFVWNKNNAADAVLMLAHGAGADKNSSFMATMADLLCERRISVVRFDFPYMVRRRDTGKKYPPDRQPVLLNCWQAVVASVKQNTSLPLFIGGKSMGGRMATLLAAENKQVQQVCSGVVCLGYPFYVLGKPDKPRIDHLRDISLPVLIQQGSRDAMGNREEVTAYRLKEPVQIEWFEDGNHDLKPRKASGLTHTVHLQKASDNIASFIRKVKSEQETIREEMN